MDGIAEEKIEARRAYQRAWYAKNQEKQRLKTAKWREANPDYSKQYARETYAANKEAENARNALYRAENKEKIAARKSAFGFANRKRLSEAAADWRSRNVERCREVSLVYQRVNPDKICANSARRRAAKLEATPKWADAFLVSEIYHLAALRTKATGIEWQVDHIIPLRSKLVCGLHCENNLRLITARENSSKGNRHWPDMP